MEVNRKIIFGLDELYTKDLESNLGSHKKVMVYNGDGQVLSEKSNGRRFGDFINIDGKQYFVKYPTLAMKDYLNGTFNELFISFLAKKLGLKCIDAGVLIDNEVKAVGVISPYFGENILLSDLSIHFYTGETRTVKSIVGDIDFELESDKTATYVYSKEDMTRELKLMACFDFLVSQRDRHCGNMAICLERRDGKIYVSLAPMFDNEDVFTHDENKKTFLLTPIDGEYGESHIKLMRENEEFRTFFENFKDLVYGGNFYKTIKEFEELYGLGEIFELAGKREEYIKILKDTKSILDEKIELTMGDEPGL